MGCVEKWGNITYHCGKMPVLMLISVLNGRLKIEKNSANSGLDEFLELVTRRGYKIARLLYYHRVVIACFTFTTYR